MVGAYDKQVKSKLNTNPELFLGFKYTRPVDWVEVLFDYSGGELLLLIKLALQFWTFWTALYTTG